MTRHGERRWVVIAWVTVTSAELALGCGQSLGEPRSTPGDVTPLDRAQGDRTNDGGGDKDSGDSAANAPVVLDPVEAPERCVGCPDMLDKQTAHSAQVPPINITSLDNPPPPPFILFAQGESSLDAEDREKLDGLVAVIIDSTRAIEVRGYAASDEGYPKRLSAARARSVYDHLVSKGVEPAKLLMRSYGVRGLGNGNRRVEISAERPAH